MSSGSWYNSDGLYLEFGTTKPVNAPGGFYRTVGELREIELSVALSGLTSTNVGTIVGGPNIKFPSLSRIQEIEVVTQTAATGSGALLNLGLVKEDQSTEIDGDGLLVALPMTSVSTAGQTLVIRTGNSFAGALLGTETSTANGPGYITADWDTAAFTGGVLRIRVKYYQANVITQ